LTPEERLDRIERSLDRHIEFVGQSLTALSREVTQLSQQVAKTAAAQEQTEIRLQTLIEHVNRIAGRVDKLEQQ
jgi:prefoldin subunit 5